MSVTVLDSSTIEVDDGHPFVFTSGTWQQIPMKGLFNDTLSYTSIKDSTKAVRFVGTPITVRGGLQQYSGNGLANDPPLSSYSLDGGPTVTYSAPSPPFYTAVTYFQSPSLSMGEHVLTIRNTIDTDLIHVDAFIIKSSDGVSPQILQSDGSPFPRAPSNPPSSTSSVGPTTSTPTTSPSTLGLATSSLPNLNMASKNSSGLVSAQQQTVSFTSMDITPLVSSHIDFKTSTLLVQNTDISHQPGTNKDGLISPYSNNTTVIASVVIASCACSALLAILDMWLHRRRHNSPALPQPFPSSQLTTNPSQPLKRDNDRQMQVPFTDDKQQVSESDSPSANHAILLTHVDARQSQASLTPAPYVL